MAKMSKEMATVTRKTTWVLQYMQTTWVTIGHIFELIFDIDRAWPQIGSELVLSSSSSHFRQRIYFTQNHVLSFRYVRNKFKEMYLQLTRRKALALYKINREQRSEQKFRISHLFLFLEWERNMQEKMIRLKTFFRLYGIDHENMEENGNVENSFQICMGQKQDHQ